MLKINNLVLASSSKQRLSLLGQMGVMPGTVVSPDIDESVLRGELPARYSARMARSKVAKVGVAYADKFVLGADTVAFCGRRVLLQTECEERVAEYMELLSGRRHRVCTTICLSVPGGGMHVRSVISVVKFKCLSLREVEYHVRLGEWRGKAGGYSIQGLAGVFVSWIQGSYSSVMGLPLHETYCILSSYFDLQHIS